MIQRARGFTLVEMLLALAILAALSVAAVTVLQNVMRADTLTRDKGERIQMLQQTFSQMAADFSQIIPRRSRDSASLFFAGRFHASGRWLDEWQQPQRLPQGLEVTLTLEPYGEIRRLFLLTPGGSQ